MKPPAPFRPRGPVTDSFDRANAANVCFYCRQWLAQDVPATVTVHDRRGCVRVCNDHAQWRETTSKSFGHSSKCPDLPQA